MDVDFRRFIGAGYIKSETNLPKLIGPFFHALAGQVPEIDIAGRLNLLESASVGLATLVDGGEGSSLVIKTLRKLKSGVDFGIEG